METVPAEILCFYDDDQEFALGLLYYVEIGRNYCQK